MPTVPCSRRRASSIARDRALAMRLAYGAIQRSGTLDHVLEASRAVPRAARPAGLRRRLRSASTSCSTWTAPRSRGRRRLSSSSQRHSSRGHGLVNAVLRRAAREGSGADRRHCARTRPSRPRSRTPIPVARAALVAVSSGPSDARALTGRRQRAGRAGAACQHALRDPATAARELGSPTHTDPAEPRRLCWRGHSTCTHPRLWQSGRVIAQSRAAMLVARVARPRSPASGCSTCAPHPEARARTSRR